MSSASAEVHSGWAWGLTLVVILAGGLALYAARSAMGSALDHWLADRQLLPEEAPSGPAVLPEPEHDAAEPTEPEWTFVDIEAVIALLPENAESLIAEGRDEIREFNDLRPAEGGQTESRPGGGATGNVADQTRALRNRWRLWGRIWHNRVDLIRRPMPPAGDCEVHAALEPTCRAVRESLAILDRIPAAASAEEARKLLDQASGVLEELRRPPEEAITPADSAVP